MEETAKKNDISRTIVARYGSIGRRDKNIEINIISWNNGRKKVDIRPWSSNGVYAQKGLTFGKESFFKLMKILNDVDISLIDSEVSVKEYREEAPLPEEPKYKPESEENNDLDIEGEEESIPFDESEETEQSSERDTTDVLNNAAS